MGPIEEHILHHLHHKDLVEEYSLHQHLLLHLHKGLVEEHIQAQASGSGGNCVNHVLIIWKDKYWDKFTAILRENMHEGVGSWNKCSLVVYMKFSCVRINIKGLSPCPKGYSVPAWYFILLCLPALPQPPILQSLQLSNVCKNDRKKKKKKWIWLRFLHYSYRVLSQCAPMLMLLYLFLVCLSCHRIEYRRTFT